MSEYITDAVICNFDGEPGGLIKHASVDITVKEEIVRCRDCKYYNECWDFCERLKPGMVVEPDGFCKWGERREK